MAYADKSCDIRRCCLAKGGHVQWEGVQFDGERFLLRNRAEWGELSSTSYVSKEELKAMIEDHNSALDDDDEELILLYQDDEDCDWHVKKDYVKKLEKKK